MKKNLYIGLAALAALTLSACQREANFNDEPGKVTVTFTADKAGDATRAAAVEGTDKVSYEWTSADIANLKLFVVGEAGLTAVEGVSTSVSSDNKVLSITATVEANSTVRAIVASKLTGKEGDTNRKPRLIATQNPATDNFDPAADILIAEDVTVSGLDNEKLNFQRPVTVNKMTLKGLTSGETVSKVVITSDKYLAGYYKYDTGMYGDGNELTIIYDNATVGSNGEFPVYFVAMENAEQTLSIKVETVKSSKNWHYSKTLGSTINFTKGKFSKFGVNLTGCGQESTNVGDGTLESPFNVSAAIAYTETLGANVESTSDVYITGVISKIASKGTYSESGSYGNATFFISDDGKTTSPQFQAYRVLYLGNKQYVSGQTDIKVGDEVILCGKVVLYNGSTPETVKSQAYLYSLNGDTGQNTSGTYSIIIASDIQHGTVTASMTENIEEGESITLTIAPDTDYALETLTVDGANVTSEVVDNKYNFDMPDHDVAVSASFKSTSTEPAFTTVAELNSIVTSTSDSYSGKLTNAVVSFVPATNTAIIKDATGSIMYYKKDHTLKQGQTFSGDITVTAIMYTKDSNPLYSEITDLGSASFTGAEAVVAPETVTLSALNGHYTDYQNAYVKVENLTVVNKDGKNINVTDGTNNYVVYLNYGNATCDEGEVITAVGTVTKYGTTEEIKVWKADDLTAPRRVTFAQPTQAGCSIAVTVDGSAITSGAVVASGKVVTLTATVGTDFAFVGWTVTGATVADASSATTTFTMESSDVDVSATFKPAGGSSEPVDATYDFTNIEGFADWSSSYSQHIVQYEAATVTFDSANKQNSTATINNMPVTKGQPVSLVLKYGTLNSVTFNCAQWGTKAQTITLHYSTDGGATYTSTGVTSTDFTISSSSLPSGTNAVKITFSSSSNQVGIESATINYTPGN